MGIHFRIVRILWLLVGIALSGYAAWGLITDEHLRPVVESWLIVLAFALVSMGAGATLGRSGLFGRVLVRLVSAAVLLYAAAWLLLGGVDDAGGYWPAIVLGVALAGYTLFASRPNLNAA